MSLKFLKNIIGFNGSNDVIVYGAETCPTLNIIYFGGDIQDLSINMREYNQYSLESTVELLYNRYKDQNCPVNVYGIRPSFYKHSTFAIFKNFVEMKAEGHPFYKSDANRAAIKQLHSLICSATQLVIDKFSKIGQSNLNKEEDKIPEIPLVNKSNSLETPVHIIGFSKGCAVLTQILYDLSLELERDSCGHWCSQIRRLFWLDSGHNGSEELWPINSKVVRSALEHCPHCSLHVYGTPFQLNRLQRMRSSKEFQECAKLIKSINERNEWGYLLQNQSNNLDTHFRILLEFPIIKL